MKKIRRKAGYSWTRTIRDFLDEKKINRIRPSQLAEMIDVTPCKAGHHLRDMGWIMIALTHGMSEYVRPT